MAKYACFVVMYDIEADSPREAATCFMDEIESSRAVEVVARVINEEDYNYLDMIDDTYVRVYKFAVDKVNFHSTSDEVH